MVISSIDELAISLTIKEGGNLDKLRKQLKAIVGSKGEGLNVNFSGIISSLNKLEGDTDFIKNNIRWLLPSRVPTSKKGIFEALTRVRTQVEADWKKISERFIPEKADAIKRMQDEYGTTDLGAVAENLMSDFLNWAKFIESSGLTGKLPQKLYENFRKLLSIENMPWGARKGLLDEFINTIGELNKMFGDWLTSKGIENIPEFYVRTFQKGLFEKVKEVNGSVVDNVMRNASLVLSKEALQIAQKYASQVKLFQKTKPLDWIKSISKQMGIDIKKYAQPTKEQIKKKPELEALAYLMGMRAFTGKGVVFPGYHEVIADIFKKMFESQFKGLKLTEIYDIMKPDFLTLLPQKEILEEVFGKEIADILGDKLGIIELKAILNKTFRRQFIEYFEKIGNVVGVGTTRKGTTPFGKEIPTAIMPDLLSRMIKNEDITLKNLELTDEELTERMKTLHEEYIVEQIKLVVKTMYDLVKSGSANENMLKSLKNDVRELLKKAGMSEEQTRAFMSSEF